MRFVRGVAMVMVGVCASAMSAATAGASPLLWPRTELPSEPLCAQLEPQVVALTDGRFMAAWAAEDRLVASGVALRTFDAYGRPEGAEQSVASGEAPAHVRMARLADTAIVAWSLPAEREIWVRAYDLDGAALGPARRALSEAPMDFALAAGGGKVALAWLSAAGVRARLLDASLSPIAPDLTIDPAAHAPSAPGPLHTPAVAVDAGGRLTVAWLRLPYAAAAGGDLVLRRFDATGSPLGSEYALTAPGSGFLPRLATLPDGGVAAVWIDGQSGGAALELRRFDASGAAIGAALRVDDALALGSPAVAASPDGRLAIAWRSATGARLRTLTADGALDDPSVALDPENVGYDEIPALAWTSAARLAAVWDVSWLPVFEPTGCEHQPPAGRLVDLDASSALPQAPAEDFTLSISHDASASAPQTAVGPDGGFAATWIENRCAAGAGPREVRVLAGAFSVDGSPKAETQTLATFDCLTVHDADSSITALGDHGFLVAWAPRGSVSGRITATRLDAAARPSGASWTLGVPGSELPLVAADRSGFFVLSRDVAAGTLRLGSFDLIGSERGSSVAVDVVAGDGALRPFDLLAPPAGGAVVAWTRAQHQVLARRYAVNLAPLSGELALSDAATPKLVPRLASDHGAGFQVAWSAAVLPGQGASAVFLRRVTAEDDVASGTVLVDAVADGDSGQVVYATGMARAAGAPTVLAVRKGAVGGPESLLLWPLDEGRLLGPPVVVPSARPAGDATVAAATCGYVVAWSPRAPVQAPAGRRFVSACGPVEEQRLAAGRFAVDFEWSQPGGAAGHGYAQPIADDTGAAWFFDPAHLDMAVHITDGRAQNGAFWVTYASLTGVDTRIVVSDTETGARRVYRKPAGRLESRIDRLAFPQSEVPTDRRVAPGAAQAASCAPSGEALCLGDLRFRAAVQLYDPSARLWRAARAVTLASWTGAFRPGDVDAADSVVLVLKMVDGRALNGKFWLFWGGLSDRQFRVIVRDTATGRQRVYRNPAGRLQSIGDTSAF